VSSLLKSLVDLKEIITRFTLGYFFILLHIRTYLCAERFVCCCVLEKVCKRGL